MLYITRPSDSCNFVFKDSSGNFSLPLICLRFETSSAYLTEFWFDRQIMDNWTYQSLSESFLETSQIVCGEPGRQSDFSSLVGIAKWRIPDTRFFRIIVFIIILIIAMTRSDTMEEGELPPVPVSGRPLSPPPYQTCTHICAYVYFY